ncbi:hypothetical protein Btru_034582 [Bulinus truncatus]|nr:hypothetical protein Btru_034582 [Bulinus truncatus]
MATDIIPAQPKTKKGKGYTATGNEEVEVASKPSKHVTYLKNTLGTILPQCLHEVCQKRPRDPIEFIALCLYKSVDCELYFYEKAIFSKELQLMALELKKENTVRQSNIEKIKKKIQELKPAKVRKKSSGQPCTEGNIPGVIQPPPYPEVDKESYSEEYAMSSKLTSSGEISRVTTEGAFGTTESAVSEQDTEDDKIDKPPARSQLTPQGRRSSKKKFKGGLSPSRRKPLHSRNTPKASDSPERPSSPQWGKWHNRGRKKNPESDVAKVKQVEPLGAREGKKPGKKKKGRKDEEIPELGAKKQDLKKQEVLEGSPAPRKCQAGVRCRSEVTWGKPPPGHLLPRQRNMMRDFDHSPEGVGQRQGTRKFPVDAVSGEDARRADTSPRRAAIPKKRVRGTSLRNELPSPVESPERHLSVSPDTHKTTQESKRKKSTGQRSKPSKAPRAQQMIEMKTKNRRCR